MRFELQIIEPFAHISAERVEGAAALRERGLRLTIERRSYPGGAAHVVTLANAGNVSIAVERVGVRLGVPDTTRERQWRVFLDQGLCSWCGVKPLEALEPDPHMEPVREQRMSDDDGVALPFHRSDLQTVLWDAASKQGFLIGFLRQRHGPNKIDIIPRRDPRDVERIEAWQELGVDLAPGASQALDVLVLAPGNDPYDLLEAFADAVMEHHKRKFDAPPVVGMMTWYGYRTAIDERLILGNAKIVGELFGGYPQPMQKLMLLDHGWQEDANWGLWEPDQKRFAHGMQWLSDELSKHQLSLGLWYTPFCITQNAPNHDHLERLQAVDAEGKAYTGEVGVWGTLPQHSSDNWTITFFDAGQDAVHTKWQRELNEMQSWGAVYWKIDFFLVRTSEQREPRVGLGEVYAKTWKTLRDAVGDNGHVAPCSCPTNLQLGYNDSLRIAADIGNSGHWPGAMEKFRYGMASIAAHWYRNRRFWVNDPDSIQLGKGCSLGEARVRATVVALSGGHLMLSEDLRDLSEDRLEMIRRIIPPITTAARPLDLFENPFPDGYPALWALRSQNAIGPRGVLAVFNLTGKTRSYVIRPEMLRIDAGVEFVALEWWQYRWLGRFNDAFTIEVPPEDVAMIHARPVEQVPSLLSVSHHVTGAHIVRDVTFDRSTGELTGALITKKGLKMTLFGDLAAGWTLSRDAEMHATVSSVRGWQSEFTTTDQESPFVISFIPTH
jgi:hypothetical protein